MEFYVFISDFSNLEEDDNIYETLLPIFTKVDSYLWIKEGVPKALAKGVVERKSVWLSEYNIVYVYWIRNFLRNSNHSPTDQIFLISGESGNRDHSCSFSETLSFVQRLGAAAKLGASVYLRKPHIESLSEPTSVLTFTYRTISEIRCKKINEFQFL